MTTIYIPAQDRKKWQGIFPSRYAGDFTQSWNVDLQRALGKVALSGTSVIAFMSDTAATAFTTPQKFLTSDAYPNRPLWALCSDKILNALLPTAFWAADTHTGSPTSNLSDFIQHGDTDISDTSTSKDRILVSNDTTIMIFNPAHAPGAWDTDWWTATDTNNGLAQTALQPGHAHIFGKVQSLVLVTDYDRAHTIDRNDVVVRDRIVFPVGYEPTCVYTSKNKYWIGLEKEAGGDGLIISWDGFSESYRDYRIEGTPVSGWITNGLPYFINNYGQILTLNGEDFEEVTHFPCYEEKVSLEVNRNGCAVDGNVVNILLNMPQFSKRMRAGVWVFEPRTGNLYHSKSLSTYGTTGDTAAHDDFGQPYLAAAGGLYNVRYTQPTVFLLAGGAVRVTGSNSDTGGAFIRTAVFTFRRNVSATAVSMRGHFVTPVIPAVDTKDLFQILWLRFRKFLHSDNKIVVKFRTADPLLSDGNVAFDDIVQPSDVVTWLNDTSFRSFASPNAIPVGVKVGHEVEILTGPNAGCLFHITSITDTNGAALVATDTTQAIVSIDEEGPSSDTFSSYVRFDNWQKAGEITDTGVTIFNMPVSGSDTSDTSGAVTNAADFIEFKVEMRGKVMEIEQLRVVRQTSLSDE